MQPTIGLAQLLESCAALMKNSGPKDLAQSFRTVLEYEGLDSKLFTLKDLELAMRSEDQQDGAVLGFARLLWGWDHSSGTAWEHATEPHSEKRRALVYRLLKLPASLAEACDQRSPIASFEAPTVIAESHVPWYPPAKLDQFYWNAYERHLRDVSGWPPESLASLDESTTAVVERLSDPVQKEAYQAKGLVVGYVQSGKTANFTGVIAKAADAGYRLFIVLGGTLDILRNQTQRRLDKELVGKELLLRGDDNEYDGDSEWDSFIRHGDLPSNLGSFDWQRLTGAHDDYSRLKKGLDALEFERVNKKAPLYSPENLAGAKARLLVIKKHPTVMERLIKDLGALRTRLADVPTLIIDDESDQASVNTTAPATAEQERARTATNLQITRLLKILPRAQYVGYTATPFANVFIDPTDVEDVFPKDFIISLKRPAHYMGVSDFYDLVDPTPAGYLSNERAFIRDVRGADQEAGNLQKAIDSFLLAGALKLFREKKGVGRFRHHTMLVHRSQRTKAHEDDAELVRAAFDNGGYGTRAGLRRLEALFETDFRPVTAARAPDLPFPKKFDLLRDCLGECIGRLESDKPVRIVNGDGNHRDDTPDFERQPVWSILVGGTKLSRGYTVEGLTISYYRRTAKAADTLMQMGRWFGYRRNYMDLVRLFIGRHEAVGKGHLDLYEAFRAICLDEEEFRSELRKYASIEEPRITPKMIPPLVPSHLLRPTSPNKMYNATVVFENYGGRWCDKTNGPSDKKDVLANQKAMRTLLVDVEIEKRALSGEIDGVERDFSALVGTLDPTSVLSFLKSYQWSGDNPHLIARQLDFLQGKHGDTRIGRWLLIAPQPTTEGKKSWSAGATSFAIRHRARIGDRYKVYTEPAHKSVGEYLCGLCEAEGPSKDLAAFRSERQGIFLFYPVRDEDEEKEEWMVTMGFALLFPRNNIKTELRFSVHDKRNAAAVTVPKSAVSKAAAP